MKRMIAPSVLVSFLLLSVPLPSQSVPKGTGSDAEGKLLLKTNVRAVKVDVLVTGRHGQPVTGLSEGDFRILENGKLQSINSFQAHVESPPEAITAPTLPPNTFINVPRTNSAGVPVVILLDSLNTPLAAQAEVRKALVKSVDDMKPGSSVAIFTLGPVLRRLQGFTDDPSVLRVALADPTRQSNPSPSLLLESKTEQAVEQQEAAFLGSGGDMLKRRSQSATETRILMTLDAFRQLSGYLDGIEGRKDVIWLSSAFPIYLGTTTGIQVDPGIYPELSEEIKQTDAALAAAQVAVYPIGAEGLEGNSLYDVGTQLSGAQGAEGVQTQSNQMLRSDELHRDADHAVMDGIAEDTGGHASYNDNGLSATLSKIMKQGGDYYTLYYQPTNADFDGSFRKIKVELPHTDDKLSYRRGYYAISPSQGSPDSKPNGVDPLVAAIVSGAPNKTSIPLAVQVEVEPIKVVPAVTKKTQAPSKHVEPETRYDLHFVAAGKSLALQPTTDGKKADTLEVALFAYDAQGKLVSWAVHRLELSLTPTQYQATETNGFNFGMHLDASGRPVILRVGAYDQSSGRLGTLEVPLDALVAEKEPTSR